VKYILSALNVTPPIYDVRSEPDLSQSNRRLRTTEFVIGRGRAHISASHNLRRKSVSPCTCATLVRPFVNTTLSLSAFTDLERGSGRYQFDVIDSEDVRSHLDDNSGDTETQSTADKIGLALALVQERVTAATTPQAGIQVSRPGSVKLVLNLIFCCELGIGGSCALCFGSPKSEMANDRRIRGHERKESVERGEIKSKLIQMRFM